MPRFKETNMRRGLHVGSCRYLRWRSHALHTIMYIIEYRETAKSQLSTIIICRCARPLKLFNKLSIYLPTYLSSSTGFYSTVNWHQFISLLFFFLSLLIHSWIIYIFIYLSLSLFLYIFFCICLSQISLSQESHVCLYIGIAPVSGCYDCWKMGCTAVLSYRISFFVDSEIRDSIGDHGRLAPNLDTKKIKRTTWWICDLSGSKYTFPMPRWTFPFNPFNPIIALSWGLPSRRYRPFNPERTWLSILHMVQQSHPKPAGRKECAVLEKSNASNCHQFLVKR